MTTAAFATRPTSFFARVWAEVEAFFDEMHAANVRTGALEPFGL